MEIPSDAVGTRTWSPTQTAPTRTGTSSPAYARTGTSAACARTFPTTRARTFPTAGTGTFATTYARTFPTTGTGT